MKKQSLFAKHFFVTHYAGWGNEHKVTVTIDFFHMDWIESVERGYGDAKMLWKDVPKYMRRYIDNI